LKVKVVNAVANGSRKIRRKDAQRLVDLGRAVWVAENQLQLIREHPANKKAADQAAAGYKSAPFVGDGRRPVTVTTQVMRAGGREQRANGQVLGERRSHLEPALAGKQWLVDGVPGVPSD
jgi:hypothetical protein